MKRRQLLTLVPVGVGLLWMVTRGQAGEMSGTKAMTAGGDAGSIRVYSVERGDYFMSEPVVRSEAQWRQLLTPEQYKILRERGTERAYSGSYHDHKEAGVYRCAGCELDLYHSSSKYDSRTGWPSFYQAVAAENIATREDRSYFMLRNELVCSRCDSHLGHLFGDGPEPSGERHCINSAALTFVRL